MHHFSRAAPGPADSSAALQICVEERVTTEWLVHIVRGAGPVLNMQDELSELSLNSGYPGAMNDLVYFIGKPGALQVVAAKVRATERLPGFVRKALARCITYVLRREPVLLLASATSSVPSDEAVELQGALLLYEYSFLRLRSGLLTTNDRSGRRCFVAERRFKSAILEACLQKACDDGGQILLVSVHPETELAQESLTSAVRLYRLNGFRLAARERCRKAYLPLLDSTESTFAQLGKRTRRNIQHCRRRTEKELGSSFVEDVQISRTDFMSMNKASMYAVNDEIAEWRYDRLGDVPSSFVAGIKDGEGMWLSLIGCRRELGSVEILWQMNANGYPHLSLALVARSFLIESEVQRGTQALLMEGGTTHALFDSFVEDTILDIALVRKSFYAKVLGVLARRAVQGGDELGLMLSRKDLDWQSK